MGGSGSTRWTLHWKKRTVEESLKLSIADLSRGYNKHFSDLIGTTGIITWNHGSKVGYYIVEGNAGLRLVFSYQVTTKDTKLAKTPVILLSTTACNYGGCRYWMHCPYCKRRIGTLYMLAGDFACRQCHHLTYSSAQEAHQFDSLKRVLGAGLGMLDRHYKVKELLEKWDDRKRLTKGERRKIADAMGVPLFMVRNRWYRPETRAKQAAALAMLVDDILV